MSSTRRSFLSAGALVTLGMSARVPVAWAQVPAVAPANSAADVFPGQDPALVREAVGTSHNNLQRLREIVERQPAYARASMDWGFGDWETCLDAAAHVGNRPIAAYLLSRGARPTIFSAAMLGQLDVVKAFVAAQPGIQKTHGAHGITLMAHARAGGKESEPVVEYLKQLGDADVPAPTQPLDPADRDALAGKYAYGPGARDYFTVDVSRERLGIDRPGGPGRRNLLHSGGLVFFTPGVPNVTITFARDGGQVTHFTIAGSEMAVTAKRS